MLDSIFGTKNANNIKIRSLYMHEASKSIFHRIKDARYATRYFIGDGIDIGCGPDPLNQYYEFFPLILYLRNLKDLQQKLQ